MAPPKTRVREIWYIYIRNEEMLLYRYTSIYAGGGGISGSRPPVIELWGGGYREAKAERHTYVYVRAHAEPEVRQDPGQREYQRACVRGKEKEEKTKESRKTSPSTTTHHQKEKKPMCTCALLPPSTSGMQRRRRQKEKEGHTQEHTACTGQERTGKATKKKVLQGPLESSTRQRSSRVVSALGGRVLLWVWGICYDG